MYHSGKGIIVVFSGDLATTGGIQSWARNFEKDYSGVRMISLGCTRSNFHYPAFRRMKWKQEASTVICCDPLSLLWASTNIVTESLVIAGFHKDEWNLTRNSRFERVILELFDLVSLELFPLYYASPSIYREIPRLKLPLYPRLPFLHSTKLFAKGKDILVLGRLEKFKGFPNYLLELSELVAEISDDIKIQIVGKGTMYNELLQRAKTNMCFHGYLNERAIIDLAKGSFIGLSSGLSAIELSSLGLPVAIALEDNDDMLLSCFTGHGEFIFQDDIVKSQNLPLLKYIRKLYYSNNEEWTGYSLQAMSSVRFVDDVIQFEEFRSGNTSIKNSNGLLFFSYLISVLLDALKIKRFNFINRIP